MLGTLGEHALEAHVGCLHTDVIAIDEAGIAQHLGRLVEVLLDFLHLLLDIGDEALLIGQ